MYNILKVLTQLAYSVWVIWVKGSAKPVSLALKIIVKIDADSRIITAVRG